MDIAMIKETIRMWNDLAERLDKLPLDSPLLGTDECHEWVYLRNNMTKCLAIMMEQAKNEQSD